MNRHDRRPSSYPVSRYVFLGGRGLRGMVTLITLGAVLLLSASSGRAEALKPSWTCAPESTVLLVRVPGGQAFFEALRERTKLGSVVFAPERLHKLLEIVENLFPEQWPKFEEALDRSHLKIEDLEHLFTGEAGMALVLESGGDGPPRPLVLGWFEPGEDLADRLYAAAQLALEEAEGPGVPRRIDLDLAGHTVMHLSIPILGPEISADLLDHPDFEHSTVEQIQEWYKQQAEKLANAKTIEIDRAHLLSVRKGNRILVGMTFGGGQEVRRKIQAGEKVDLDEAGGLGALTTQFAQFLSAHDDTSASPLTHIYDTLGLAAALPSGTPLAEVVFDPHPFFKLAAEAKDGEQSQHMLSVLGLTDAGAGGARISLDGSLLRWGVFVSAPAPRHGVLTLLDQPPLPAEPPSWVPANVVQYTHMGFDLGKAYARIKEMAIAEGGEQAQAGFDMAEAQVAAQLQTDIASLLSSLGQQHTWLTFPPQPSPKIAEANPDHPLASSPTNRTAFVWQVKNEDLWKRIIDLASKFTGTEVKEEQGFSGIRTPESMMSEGGLFVGRGYLVLGIGDDVVEATIVALRNPPAGEASLLGSPLYRRAVELMPPQPALVFSLTDTNRVFKSAYEGYEQLMERFKTAQGELMEAATPEAARSRDMLEKLHELIPTPEEMEGTFGLRVTQAVVDEQGLTIRAIDELPAPR